MDRLIQQPVVASPLDDKTDIKLFPHLKTTFRNCQCVCARVCVCACMYVVVGGGGEIEGLCGGVCVEGSGGCMDVGAAVKG